MKIYLDFVFIINFFFDFLLLYGTSKILKRIVPLKNIIIGSLIGTITLFFLFFDLSSAQLFLAKIILSIIIIVVTFGKKNLFQNITYFYLLSIILGGSLYLLDITITYENKGFMFIKNGYALNVIIIVILAPIIVGKYIKEHLNYKTKISNKYQIEIHINENKYILEAILDTGNTLADPYKKRPVILIDENINYKRKKIIYVPYKALNTTGIIPCILPDKIIINKKEFKNYLIGLSKDKFSLDGASCILPNKLKEELC